MTKYRIFDEEVNRQWNDFEGNINDEITNRFNNYWIEDRDNGYEYVITVWDRETQQTTYYVLEAGAWLGLGEDEIPDRTSWFTNNIEELGETAKGRTPKIKPDKDYIIV